MFPLVPVLAPLHGPAVTEASRGRTSSLGWVRLSGAEACVGPRALAQSVEETLGRTVFVSPARIEACGKPAPAWFWGAHASAVMGTGYLPGGPMLGLTVGGLVQPPRWWIFELGATWWARREAKSSSGQATDLTLAYGNLAVCPLFAGGGSERAVRWRGCVGGQAGSFAAEGKQLDVVQQPTRWVVNAATYVRLFWPLAPPFGLQAGLGLAVPVLRETFVYYDQDGSRRELFQLPPVTAWADVGLSVHFL